jgi:hypothetical protein
MINQKRQMYGLKKYLNKRQNYEIKKGQQQQSKKDNFQKY